MPFGLEDSYVVFDDNNFATQRDVNNDRHYHEERIEVKGILNFGYIGKNDEVQIDLEVNNINSPIIIDSIVALSGMSSSDEIYFYLYQKTSEGLTRVGTQRFSNSQMPVDFPDGVIFPGMVLGAKPVRADATITVYVKPVKVLFQAYPAPALDG